MTTKAELDARVAMLEAENARLEGDWSASIEDGLQARIKAGEHIKTLETALTEAHKSIEWHGGWRNCAREFMDKVNVTNNTATGAGAKVRTK